MIITMKKRQIFDKIWENINSYDILILTGARQVGKTTLMLMLKKKLIEELKIDENDIYFYDLEGLTDRQIWQDRIIIEKRLINSSKAKKIYVFIDEFQKVPEITSILKYIHDHFKNIKFIVSGSSSIAINDMMTESMMGRSRTFFIYPLSFQEFLEFKNFKNELNLYQNFMDGVLLAPSEIELLNDNLKEFFIFGSYPKITLEKQEQEKKEMLKNIINNYLAKDIQLLVRKKSMPAFEKMLSVIAAQDGLILNINKISKILKINYQTAVRYFDILKYTYLLNFIPAFSQNIFVEISKMERVYFFDQGFKNSLNNNFSYIENSSAIGFAAENFAISEILKNTDSVGKVFYWRTKQGQEVDIIFKKENLIVPIEVKSGSKNSTPSGLKSFINKYNPAKAYVLNKDVIKKEKHGSCEIEYLPIWAVKKTMEI